jgi:hypothetical protein
MKHLSHANAFLLAIVMITAACSSGDNAVLTNPGNANAPFAADIFLPAVNTVDSGVINLTNGRFNGAGENLVFTEPFSGSRLRIPDQTSFSGPDQIFDTDGDADYDYIILTLRALSAQAAESVNASGALGAGVNPRTFYKVAGISILPLDSVVAASVDVTLPISAAGNPSAGKQYQLYRWTPAYGGPGEAYTRSTGSWQFVSNVTADSTGNTVTFTVSRLGQYAVATDAITIASGT